MSEKKTTYEVAPGVLAGRSPKSIFKTVEAMPGWLALIEVREINGVESERQLDVLPTETAKQRLALLRGENWADDSGDPTDAKQ